MKLSQVSAEYHRLLLEHIEELETHLETVSRRLTKLEGRLGDVQLAPSHKKSSGSKPTLKKADIRPKAKPTDETISDLQKKRVVNTVRAILLKGNEGIRVSGIALALGISAANVRRATGLAFFRNLPFILHGQQLQEKQYCIFEGSTADDAKAWLRQFPDDLPQVTVDLLRVPENTAEGNPAKVAKIRKEEDGKYSVDIPGEEKHVYAWKRSAEGMARKRGLCIECEGS